MKHATIITLCLVRYRTLIEGLRVVASPNCKASYRATLVFEARSFDLQKK